jgi:hypothetical protein
MSINTIDAREKFIQRQIDRAWEIAEYYDKLGDFTSAAVFQDWAWRAEAELEQQLKQRERGGWRVISARDPHGPSCSLAILLTRVFNYRLVPLSIRQAHQVL